MRLVIALAVPALAASVGLQAHGEVEASQAFEVGWSGPVPPGDALVLVPAPTRHGEAAPRIPVDAAAGDRFNLTAPVEPGTDAVHYVAIDETLVSMPLTVEGSGE